MAGWKVPGYAVEGLIGRGGTAEVWQGRVVRSGDRVALKRIPVDDADTLTAARAEAALLSTLDHPNLVRLHEFVVSSGAAVLVLDLASGGSLAELIRARGRLTVGEVITALSPVAAALAHAHAASVVHADVSAANVLFTADGVPLLSDLGVARLVGDRRPVACPPAYADPAVVAGAPPTASSDVFMLGGVVLHALTGTPTWPGPSAEAALNQARTGRITGLAERLADADVPELTAAVVLRALHPEPARRGSAAELALDLRHSGAPARVELGAGRIRRVAVAGPRHAAARHAAGRAQPGRPDFERPTALSSVALAQLPPTRMVGPRPRPVLPRRPDRRPRRWRWAVAASVAASALAAVALAWAPWQASAPAPASPSPSASLVWLRGLEALDARRSSAFARRDPRLLAGVYASQSLRRQDAATLARVVPAGCALTGLRTTYSRAVVSSSGSRAVIVVWARLSASVLRCPGHAGAAVSGAGPTRLRIALCRTAAGVAITAMRST